MKNFIPIIISTIVCTQLYGCGLSNWNRTVKANSDLKYSANYNPDPQGYLRHDGKYISDSRFPDYPYNDFNAGRRSLYFFPNGSFYIDYEPASAEDLWSVGLDGKKVPLKRYGIYRVIDKGMIEVNMYDYDRKYHTHYMHTDYYRVNPDSTVQAFMRLEANGVETGPDDTSNYSFVKADTMPSFEIPTESIKWLKSKK